MGGKASVQLPQDLAREPTGHGCGHSGSVDLVRGLGICIVTRAAVRPMVSVGNRVGGAGMRLQFKGASAVSLLGSPEVEPSCRTCPRTGIRERN